jgi:hypothetical protein
MPGYGSAYAPGYSGYFPLGSSTAPSAPEYTSEYYAPSADNYYTPGYNGYFYNPAPGSYTYTPGYSSSAGQGYFYP